MSEFSIIQEDNFIRIDITDGDQFAWIAQDTYINAFGDGNAVKIGANGTDLIELDFTKSILPAVTSGTDREDYINDVLDLINIVSNKPIAIFGGITSAATLDVSIDGGVIGITSAAPIEIFGGVTAAGDFEVSITGPVTINGIVGITSVGPIEIFGGITAATTLPVSIVGGMIGVTGAAGPEGLLNDVIGVTESVAFNRVTNDWKLDISNTLLTGKICFNLIAFDDEIGTSSSDIGDGSSGIGFNWFETADTIDVVSTKTDDDNTGSRARTIVIEGLDATFTGVSETIALAGKTPVTSVNSYIRVNRTYVTSSGTYHFNNRGDISLRRNTGGLKYTSIKSTIGTSRQGVFTVPAGKTAFITNIQTSINEKRRGKVAVYKLENADDVSVPVGSPEVVWQTAFISSVNSVSCYIKIPEKSDFWVRGSVDFSAGDFSVVMAIYLVDN